MRSSQLPGVSCVLYSFFLPALRPHTRPSQSLSRSCSTPKNPGRLASQAGLPATLAETTKLSYNTPNSCTTPPKPGRRSLRTVPENRTTPPTRNGLACLVVALPRKLLISLHTHSPSSSLSHAHENTADFVTFHSRHRYGDMYVPVTPSLAALSPSSLSMLVAPLLTHACR